MTHSVCNFQKMTEAETGKLLGLSDEQGVCRQGVANACRMLVDSRRMIPRSVLVHWIAGLLENAGTNAALAMDEARSVVSSMLLMGDLGRARALDREMILSVEPKIVSLPDGKFVQIGLAATDRQATDAPPTATARNEIRRIISEPARQPSVSLSELLGSPFFLRDFPIANYSDLISHAKASDNLSAETQSWVDLSKERASLQQQDWIEGLDRLPEQLARALLLCGECQPDQASWSTNGDCIRFLNDWLGIPLGSSLNNPHNLAPDLEQQRIIHTPVDARLIVEAGPGSGKTMVACQRIAYLVEEGAAASRIWLLSFTRVAVEEMRNRIGSALDDPHAAAEINVATFDSFASQLNNALQENTDAPASSYEANIKQATGLLKSDNMQAPSFLSTLEHVVIDEAQDIVGIRRQLVLALLERLNKNCGATVFADFAQAIYGWQEKKTGSRQKSLLQSLRESSWQDMSLVTDHRTRDEKLSSMFKNARDVLRNEEMDPEEKYDEVRRVIQDTSDTVSGSWMEQTGRFADSMVLFRGRGALLATAEKLRARQVPFRLKLTNMPDLVAPWIGGLLAGQGGRTKLEEKLFDLLWNELWPEPVEITRKEAWDELRRLSRGSGKRKMRIGDLCSELDRHVPSHLLASHSGSTGPFLGTIHAAKGREAERVLLMLPGKRRKEPDTGWEEEARVLYVGASRARQELLAGPGKEGMRLWKGRAFRGKLFDKNHPLQIEIGLAGDIEGHTAFEEIAGLEDKKRVHAGKLWKIRNSSPRAFAERSSADHPYLVYLENDKDRVPLAALSSNLTWTLANIAQKKSPYQLPHRLAGFHIAAITTVVAVSTGSSKPPEFSLAPVLGGLVTIRL